MQHDIPKDVATSSESYSLLMETADSSSERVHVPNGKNIPNVPGSGRASLPDDDDEAGVVLPRRKAPISASSSAEG